MKLIWIKINNKTSDLIKWILFSLKLNYISIKKDDKIKLKFPTSVGRHLRCTIRGKFSRIMQLAVMAITK